MKVCCDCKVNKSVDNFGSYRAKHRGGKVYLRSYCLMCERAYNKEMYDKRVLAKYGRVVGAFKPKTCPRCKGLGPFGRCKGRKDGLKAYCKECVRIMGKESRERNRERDLARHKAYRQTAHGKEVQRLAAKRWRDKYPEAAREISARYYYKNDGKNKERRRLKATQWRDENREHVRERNRQWNKNNPDKLRRKSLKMLYGITVEQWEEMFEGQGRCCAICGTDRSRRKMATDHDHKTGQIRGILCHWCNLVLGQLGDFKEPVADRLLEILTYLLRGEKAKIRVSR